ncbi:hypothetical protein H072_10539 [Dactylellina haptotyla CBS 200.50]|uniref:Uncharacterized protein n=1 Tax=Dactylellina haptotyla (strain CBS 200.50) TaxID=1284197 RepID=S8BAC2_DACHA|nr:hypothetical protein H072_10539 [Dactylellina haptotyla CBS 200.50]
MTRKVHRVPLGPFLVLFLIPLLSTAQSTIQLIKPSLSITASSTIRPASSSESTATATIEEFIITTTTNSTAPSATSAAAEPSMLATFSYFGIAVGCTILIIFALTAFFTWRRKNKQAEQPPMTNAKKEYIEYFKGRGDVEMNTQGGVINSLNSQSMPEATGSSVNLLPRIEIETHERSGSLGKFHFTPFSKSKTQEEISQHTLQIEVTSNPSLRPVSNVPDYLVPKRLKPQTERPPPSLKNAPPVPPIPKLEVPGKVIYQEPSSSPAPQKKIENGNYKFPSKPSNMVEGRRGQAQPFTPTRLNANLTPISANPQPKLKEKEIPHHLRPMSSTTIASNSTRGGGGDESDHGEDDDDSYSYHSSPRSSRHSIDSYYTNHDRAQSLYSEHSGWSYEPSLSSQNIVAGQVYADGPAPLNYSKKGKGVAANEKVPKDNNTNLYPPRTTSRKIQEQYPSIDRSSDLPPPPPPKDWEVVPIKIDPYPSFVAAVKPGSSSGAPRHDTPRPILKGGAGSSGLPTNPRPAKTVEWYNRDPHDVGPERDVGPKVRVGPART